MGYFNTSSHFGVICFDDLFFFPITHAVRLFYSIVGSKTENKKQKKKQLEPMTIANKREEILPKPKNIRAWCLVYKDTFGNSMMEKS